MARETLRAWQEKNHPWLQLSDVHRETTDSIRITVIPFYMGCRVRIHVCFLFACLTKISKIFILAYWNSEHFSYCIGYKHSVFVSVSCMLIKFCPWGHA